VGHRACRAGTGEGVENDIAGVGGYFKSSLNKTLRFGCLKDVGDLRKEGHNLFFCLLGITDLLMKPDGLRDHALPHLAQKAF
jgi:hypothetical protein